MRVRGVTSELQQAAWNLRREMTPAEALLWQWIRNKQLAGLRFRAQHPVGQFVLDFYCAACRLVVELDGDIHNRQRDQDQARTEYLQTYGYHVIRFPNREVTDDLPSVLERIQQTAENLLAPPELGAGGPLAPPELGAGGPLASQTKINL